MLHRVSSCIGLARGDGCTWQGGEKIGVIYRESLYVHPQHTKCTPRQRKSEFSEFLGHFFAVRGKFGASISSFRPSL